MVKSEDNYIPQKLEQIRERLFDYWVLFASLLSIGGGIFMILFAYFYLDIRIDKPYYLYTALIFLGLVGFRQYKKENS